MGKAALKELGLYLRQAEGAHSHFLAHGTMACVQALGEPRPRLLCSVPGESGISTPESCPSFNAGLIAFGAVLSAPGLGGLVLPEPT